MTNPNAAWYFLSALAQCAAALAALAAVFATFRLQINRNLIEEAVDKGRQRLSELAHIPVEYASHGMILSELAARCQEGKGDKIACQLLEEVTRHKLFPGILANELGVPLKLWITVFLASVSPLVLEQLPNWYLGLITIILLVLTVLAIVSSNAFVQTCLGRAAGLEKTARNRVEHCVICLSRSLANIWILAPLLGVWLIGVAIFFTTRQ